MLTLPNAIVSVLIPFATLFSTPTWRKAQVLLLTDFGDSTRSRFTSSSPAPLY